MGILDFVFLLLLNFVLCSGLQCQPILTRAIGNYSESVDSLSSGRHLTENRNVRPDWRMLREVNGLKNNEVVVFVLSTSGRGQKYMWER
jgi:hypothetical protein